MGKIAFGAPLVLTFIGTDYLRFKNIWLLRYLVRRWVDTIICVSLEMEVELRELLPGKRVVYVPNGVDLDIFRNFGCPRKDQLISVGRLKWQKGYEHLLAAMQRVVAQQPQIQLLIVGEGPLRGELERRVRSMRLEQNVTFVGTLPQSEISRHLNESRLFVLASVSEGLPKALLEAMACGLPVVVTDVGGCRQVSQGAGIIVPPGEPLSLAGAILTLLNNRSLWEFSSLGDRH